MSTIVPMYGFGGGGGTGATLTVTAPSGCTVTVTKDGKTKTKTAGADGVAVFKGLATGQWTVNMTDGAQTAPTRTADITADYAIAMSFFSATIHVTYPAGSTCTATDGVTTLTAPDTSGTWDCVVPNAGTWTVSTGNGFRETVEVSANGEDLTLSKWYLFNNGDTHDSITGGWDITYGRGSGTIGDVISLKTQGPSGATYGTCALSTNNQINLTGCKKLCFQIACTNSTGTASSTYRRFGYKADGKIAFLSGSTINEPTAYAVAAVGDTEVNVPVSDISGYVGVAIKTNESRGTTTEISAIWIEG